MMMDLGVKVTELNKHVINQRLEAALARQFNRIVHLHTKADSTRCRRL